MRSILGRFVGLALATAVFGTLPVAAQPKGGAIGGRVYACDAKVNGSRLNIALAIDGAFGLFDATGWMAYTGWWTTIPLKQDDSTKFKLDFWKQYKAVKKDAKNYWQVSEGDFRDWRIHQNQARAEIYQGENLLYGCLQMSPENASSVLVRAEGAMRDISALQGQAQRVDRANSVSTSTSALRARDEAMTALAGNCRSPVAARVFDGVEKNWTRTVENFNRVGSQPQSAMWEMWEGQFRQVITLCRG